MEKEIGQGNFGKVYQGYVDMYEVQRFEVAIKEAQVQNAKNDMLEEAKAMIRVSKHDHIVNIQGLCQHNNSVYLLLEFCALGAIDDFLRKQSKLDTHNILDMTQWCRQVADGMGFL